MVRFAKRYDIPAKDIDGIFIETKKWLWLCHEHTFDKGSRSAPRDLSIYFCNAVIDEMWHEFILFTREYETFCSSTFGRYIHHEPDEASSPSKGNLEREFDRQLGYVYDKLGAGTVITWYETYPAKYGPKALAGLRR